MNVDGTPIQRLERHCSAGEWAEAERLCEAMLASEPSQPALLLLSGEIAIKRGDLAAARARLRRAGQTETADVKWLQRLANLMLYARDLESAEATLRHLLRLAPRHLGAWCALGEVNEALGRVDQAVAAYEAAAALSPAHTPPHTARSILLLRRAWGAPLPSPPDKRQKASSSGRIAMTTLGKNGRLGNQIIQYAFLRFYGLVHDLRVEVPDWIGRWLFDLDDPRPTGRLPVLREENSAAAGPHLAESSPPLLANHDVWGYFGCHTSYFHPYQSLFRTLFRPGAHLQPVVAPAMARLRTRGRTVVAIHLRRGDFTGGPLFWPAPSSWYVEWLSRIWNGLADPVLYVASDDTDVHRDFAKFAPVTAKDFGEGIPGAEMYPDFHVLSQADLLATSNSSFSMCAALLNTHAGTFVRPVPSERRLLPFDPWSTEIMLRAT